MHKSSYEERAVHIRHPLSKKILRLMAEKETNLALSADLSQSEPLVELVNSLASEICVLKLHVDLITDFSPLLIKQLQELAEQHQFFILEDRKFADIGHITAQQYTGGIYQIAKWADLVTVHSLPGPGIIEGLRKAAQKVTNAYDRGCLLLAEMSSSHNLLTNDYTNSTLELAKQYPDFVVGFIAQKRWLSEPDFLYFTPGISVSASSDTLGQSYSDPRVAIVERGSDVIIVGRSITEASSPKRAAQDLRKHAWNAYKSRLQA